MTVQEFIKATGMTHKQLSERFGIPKRTIEDWSRGVRKCPEYVVKMMEEILKGDNKMRYHVTHSFTGYHADTKIVNEYIIEAESPLKAAQMAHAMANGCDDFSTGGECRSAFERYADMVREDKEYYNTFIRGNANKNRRVYVYDNLSQHVIWVEWKD